MTLAESVAEAIREEAIAGWSREGASAGEMAKRPGMDPAPVAEAQVRMRQDGQALAPVESRPRPPGLTSGVVAEVRGGAPPWARQAHRMARQGKPIAEIAAELGRAPRAVRFWVGRHGAARVRPESWRTCAVVERMWSEGRGGGAIAAALGLSEKVVYKRVAWMRARGWDLERRGPGAPRSAWWRARADEIAKMWAEGLTVDEIAGRLEQPPGSVRTAVGRLRSEGHQLVNRYRRGAALDPRSALLVGMWKDGLPVSEIAGALGMTPSGARSKASSLRRGGVELPRRSSQGPPRRYDYGRLVELWNSGVSCAEIGEELGTSPEGVSALAARLRRVGLPVRYRRAPATQGGRAGGAAEPLPRGAADA